MILQELINRKGRIDELFEKAKMLQDPLMQAHWTRYLCLLTCSFIAIGIPTVCYEWTRNKTHANIRNFAWSRLMRRPRNINMEEILQMIGAFSPQWRDIVKPKTEGKLKDAVNSVLSNRDRIAHGDDVYMSLGDMKRYYESVVEVLELVEKVVLST